MRIWLCVLAIGCGSSKSSPPANDKPAPSPKPAAPAPASAPVPKLDTAGMDRSVSPGDDFFAFANGTWLKSTEIPADRSNWGTGPMLVEVTAKRVRDLIEDAAANGAPNTDARKIGDYYASFMDEAAIEAKGIAPLEPALANIAKIGDAKQLAQVIGETLRADVDVLNNTNFYTDNLFGIWIAADLDDPARYTAFVLQGGLGVPDRDYFVDPAPRMAEIRAKYEAHVAAMLDLAKIADAPAKAKRIVELERKIAQAHAPRVDSADVHKGNNHWARRDFATRAPGIDWDALFAGASLDKQSDFVVWHPKAVTGIAALVKSQPLDAWKDYLTFHAIQRASAFLPKAFVDQSFAFYGGVLAGTPKLRDRWKRGVDATQDALGWAVGKLYAAKYFPPAEKARAEEMVKNEVAAFATRIDKLDWMTPATKQKAKAKLAALKVGVGYPETWRDYAALDVVKGDALGNAQRASKLDFEYNLAKLGRPVDRGEWMMVPQLVNAVNLPALNALNFPAAILQPPYFDPARPSAMDYGSIGAVIGHEISHSFDDQGALFDATGRLNNWWTPDDSAHFKASSAKLVEQYNAYRPFADLALNGKLTISENIADVAGLAVAYDAYRIAVGGKQPGAVEGFSGDQLLFISFAQSWRAKYREPALRARILTDGHSPGEYRADTVRNIDAWYDAFAVKPTDKLNLAPDARVRIW